MSIMIKTLNIMVNDSPWNEVLIAPKIAFNKATANGVTINNIKLDKKRPGVLKSSKTSLKKMAGK